MSVRNIIRVFAVCTVSFAALSSISCKYRNNLSYTPPPEKPENKPKPEDILTGTHYSGQLALADPFIYVDRENSVYYIFGTSTPAQGFKAYKSPDLERWVQAEGGALGGYALHRSDVMVESGGKTYSDKDFWAPELYRLSDDRYMMLYTADEHVYAAEAASPCGPFRQNTTGFTPDAKGIDNSLFIDTDGRAYMYWVRFEGGNVIYAAELDESFASIRKETITFCFKATQSWELDLGKVNEGPAVFRHGGLYYMVYSGNDFHSQNYGVGVATATSPLGPWTKDPDNPLLCKPGGLVGTGHCSVFTDLDGNMKMVFHAHASILEVGPRQTYITDLAFETVGGQEKLVAGRDCAACYLYTL